MFAARPPPLPSPSMHACVLKSSLPMRSPPSHGVAAAAAGSPQGARALHPIRAGAGICASFRFFQQKVLPPSRPATHFVPPLCRQQERLRTPMFVRAFVRPVAPARRQRNSRAGPLACLAWPAGKGGAGEPGADFCVRCSFALSFSLFLFGEPLSFEKRRLRRRDVNGKLERIPRG